MIRLFPILFFVISCGLEQNIANAVNYDHCDEFSEMPDVCADMEETCYGNYTEFPNDDPENNDVCCCEYVD